MYTKKSVKTTINLNITFFKPFRGRRPAFVFWSWRLGPYICLDKGKRGRPTASFFDNQSLDGDKDSFYGPYDRKISPYSRFFQPYFSLKNPAFRLFFLLGPHDGQQPVLK